VASHLTHLVCHRRRSFSSARFEPQSLSSLHYLVEHVGDQVCPVSPTSPVTSVTFGSSVVFRWRHSLSRSASAP
jgi:hypothetical protein